MCLIAFSLNSHERSADQYAVILAANRDEAHSRPTESARFWSDAPDIYGGRDLQASGTWLGVTRRGRFAALTNVRDPSARRFGLSRGALVRSILESHESIDELSERATREAAAYPSFNLIVGEGSRILYVRDDGAPPVAVAPGVHGLSNARLDVEWPKVVRAKQFLSDAQHRGSPLDREAVFSMLGDRSMAVYEKLPHTGVPTEVEHMLSASFIVSPEYGTRCSTLLLVHRDGTVELEERSFDRQGQVTHVSRETIVRAP